MKKILVTMLEAGAGHKMPALAVQEALGRLFPGQYQVDVVDFALAAGAVRSDKMMKGSWNLALAHPFLAKIGYRFANALWPFSLSWNRHYYPEFKARAGRFVQSYKPDLIFSTNFITATMSATVRKKLGLDIEVVSYVTDPFDAFGWWADPQLDFICVASNAARDNLLERGISLSKVVVLDFPIHKKFFSIKESPEELRKRLGLREGMPTILTTEGGQGIGKISQFVKELYRKSFHCNVVSVCGRNEKLRTELNDLVAQTPSETRLVPLGFVDNMNELLGVADLCVAKAGASTMFEALHKGVPLIFSSWATYNEKPNVEFCLERNIGWYAPDFPTFLAILTRLFDEKELDAAKKRVKALHLRSGSDDVARFLHERLKIKGSEV